MKDRRKEMKEKKENNVNLETVWLMTVTKKNGRLRVDFNYPDVNAPELFGFLKLTIKNMEYDLMNRLNSEDEEE